MIAAKYILFVVAAFIFGSIPFGLIIGKELKGIDIRDFGSGNIGAANCFRALGPIGGTLVLLCDVMKGWLPVYLSQYLVQSNDLLYLQGLYGHFDGISRLLLILMISNMLAVIQVLSGLFSILGHNYSIFLKFKGGKGIATSLGVIIALNWKIALICFGIWLLMVLVTKYSSVGSLSGSLAFPVLTALNKEPLPYIIFSLVACLSAFHAHRRNIKNLLEGKELKITEKHERSPERQKQNGEPAESISPRGL